MKTKLLFALTLFTFLVRSQESPPRYRYTNSVWLGYFNSTTIGKKWNVNTDIQYRGKEWLAKPSQFLVRSGLGYKLNDKVKLTLGAAHLRFYLTGVATRGEWRPWQELLINDALGKIRIAHRFRVEQRFNQKVVANRPVDDYSFNWRFRYRIEATYPIIKNGDKGISFVAGNEILINTGNNIRYNYFDQDRLYAGLNFEQNKRLTYQVEFMQIWQQQSNGLTLDKISIIRFNVFHKINL
jgi:hypothetical protein